jgi:hypothetical protein
MGISINDREIDWKVNYEPMYFGAPNGICDSLVGQARKPHGLGLESQEPRVNNGGF